MSFNELDFPDAGDAHLAAALSKAGEAERAREAIAKLESENAKLLDKTHSQENAIDSWKTAKSRLEEEMQRFAKAADAKLAAAQKEVGLETS